MKIPQFLLDALSPGAGVSEKRISRMVIVNTLLILTVVDFFSNGQKLDWTIFSTWLGFAGYDGFRISQEKKFQAKTETTVTGGTVQKSSEVTSGDSK